MAIVVVSAALVVLYGIGTARIARVETVDETNVTPAPGAKVIRTRSGRV
jgi:hypothetical protein